MHPAEVVAADQLLGDRHQLVGEDHHVVAVPAHAAADVQQDLVEVHEHRRDLVRDDLGRMKMAGVQAEELLARDGIAEVELVRADDVALRADAEELALDGVAVVTRDRSARRRSRRARRRDAARGPLRSIGLSLEPSGIQTLVTQGVPRALPIAAPIRRQAMPWSIQNRADRLDRRGPGCNRLPPAGGRRRWG